MIITSSVIRLFNFFNSKDQGENKIYALIIISISIFIILFICYNEKSLNLYNKELAKINNLCNVKYDDINNIISNYNEINRRILFLEEIISHYQNNSNNFASLWLTLLSVLFITVTGFNLYSYNEKKKILDTLIKRGQKAFPENDKNANLNNNFNNQENINEN